MLKKTNIKDKKQGKSKKGCDKEIIITIEFGKFYVIF
jgi:hypothetical protein